MKSTLSDEEAEALWRSGELKAYFCARLGGLVLIRSEDAESFVKQFASAIELMCPPTLH